MSKEPANTDLAAIVEARNLAEQDMLRSIDTAQAVLDRIDQERHASRRERQGCSGTRKSVAKNRPKA